VVARQVREGEDPNVDLTQVSVNPRPLYPEVWYRSVDKNAKRPAFDPIVNPYTSQATTMPTYTMPTYTIPTYTIPTYTIPTYTVQTVTAQTVTAQTVTAQTVTAQTVTAPTVTYQPVMP
jgi:hypothetical protein